ncbi:MAG: hypothetical protein OEU54_17095, partial [Gemmatimonadota bacterium]|nr:hypothetical protein [Gemmatimonadota bacterium]
GGCVFRAYRWEPACVSLGRNQPTTDRLGGAPVNKLRPGTDVVRRPTGGRAVFHGPELTYAFVSPDRAFGGPRGIYHAVHASLARALRGLGVPLDEDAGAEGSANRLALDLEECFVSPAPGEIMARGRKLVGSAQRRHRGAVLQHGSVLFVNRQARASESGEGGESAIGLDELGIDISFEALRRHFADELGRELGVDGAEAEPPSDIVDLAASLEARYATPDWTWRR